MIEYANCDMCGGDIPMDEEGWILEEDIGEAYIPPDGPNVLLHAECQGTLYEWC